MFTIIFGIILDEAQYGKKDSLSRGTWGYGNGNQMGDSADNQDDEQISQGGNKVHG